MEYYSAIKNEILLFVTTWMDLCKVKDYRKTDSDFMYVWNLKNKTSEQKKNNKTETDSEIQRKTQGCQRKGSGGDGQNR